MPKRTKRDDRFLVAYPSGFPGVAIPLLSDEECRSRGIEPGRWPPRETWTQEQRDAGDRLLEILLPHAYQEVLQIMLAEIEREPVDPRRSDTEVEKDAALGGIRLVESGKWKQRDTTVHFPNSWILQILRMIAQGDLSLVDPPPAKQPRKTRRPAKVEATPSRPL